MLRRSADFSDELLNIEKGAATDRLISDQRKRSTIPSAIAVIGIDIGKNLYHVVDHDARVAIVLRQKWSRGQVEVRISQKRDSGFAN
ncbi:hypothetical protein ACVIHI_008392 [Bradyrhizobium sp. USDA 4524]|uniref:hypothetical protein n=1 Tax=unclassified Bradyrhizobium TaxID=2631580 RepID=UPI002115BD1F|nr:hypothetical protein [Bradyrhizobium sp. USDA 4538]MCP1899249.1 hypothetical protein [Bradyrhizobium sp. USDA 4537]MCP1986639.1 hypothetical protein [Bradyrhizobium sp. USDA 4539]